VGDGGRKPCTLGYQFIMRGGSLHCFYPMRSCDLIRHVRDDMYLAVRLMLHVLDQCRHRATNWPWVEVKPASLVMHMTSLHCFVNDVIDLQKERDAAIMGGLS
jgi:thymidylate synthase